ncbi:PREDICTED: PTB domain-containing engulfment adapter protein 1, partial [Fulmarus glacialis]|uniref:PTB domain-containing engulfment adapter protein 1 n=1 Tax=Fulmarus glacialis TaxID=30455 RepID=UPI00051AAEB0
CLNDSTSGLALVWGQVNPPYSFSDVCQGLAFGLIAYVVLASRTCDGIEGKGFGVGFDFYAGRTLMNNEAEGIPVSVFTMSLHVATAKVCDTTSSALSYLSHLDGSKQIRNLGQPCALLEKWLQFLGSTEVEQPKGTEVVRDAVRKLKFARHIKKSEGQKTPKVELQISIYGVKILDPKTKEVQHNCQLHRISFCADDKTDKRIFTFICKDSESNKHLCYVFDSEKCAEEITLTIGQAFDLAYRKFLESGGKDVETRKQIAGLQKRIQELETENTELKNKVQDLENQLRITQVHASP